MVNLFNKIINYYVHIMEQIVGAKDDHDMKIYEGLLITSVMSPMIVLASVFNLFLGFFWRLPIAEVIFIFFGLLFSGLGISYFSRTNIRLNLKIQINSLLILFAVLIVFFIYYEKIGILFWFIPIIILILSTMRTDKTYLIYLAGAYPLLYVMSILKYHNHIIVVDKFFNFALFLMLCFVVASAIIVNNMYRIIMKSKNRQLVDMLNQKDEIAALYEEIVASEDTLKEQNDMLNAYNSEIKSNQDRLQFLAYSDTLTGLPNRKMILEQLEFLIEVNRDNGRTFALAFIDLDDFKIINDSRGHAAGDMLLIQVAERMNKLIHKTDTLGRLGGDELALIIRRNLASEDLFSYIQSLCALFEEPFELESGNTKVTASFGIAIWPVDADDTNNLLKAADTAMYKAKESGKNRVQFYRKEMENEILSKIEMENDMMNALNNHEFFLEYQPLFVAKTQEISGFEALIRWASPQKGRISPADFIPFAEENGFISEMGEWVIIQVCRKINEIRTYYKKKFVIAVNVSTIQMRDIHFVERVKDILKSEGVDPSYLDFEITESVFIHDKNTAIKRLNELRALGIKLSMDDFGTGYSSLSYLLELPIDKLKIDRAFIMEIHDSNRRNAIVGAIIEMVHSLNIQVVAEGVENEEQLNYLRNENCDLIQGFLLSRPLSEAHMEKLLRSKITD